MEGKETKTTKKYEEQPGVREIFSILIVVVVVQLHGFAKTHRIGHLKMMNFTVYN